MAAQEKPAPTSTISQGTAYGRPSQHPDAALTQVGPGTPTGTPMAALLATGAREPQRHSPPVAAGGDPPRVVFEEGTVVAVPSENFFGS